MCDCIAPQQSPPAYACVDEHMLNEHQEKKTPEMYKLDDRISHHKFCRCHGCTDIEMDRAVNFRIIRVCSYMWKLL